MEDNGRVVFGEQGWGGEGVRADAFDGRFQSTELTLLAGLASIPLVCSPRRAGVSGRSMELLDASFSAALKKETARWGCSSDNAVVQSFEQVSDWFEHALPGPFKGRLDSIAEKRAEKSLIESPRSFFPTPAPLSHLDSLRTSSPPAPTQSTNLVYFIPFSPLLAQHASRLVRCLRL
jgi:hypothetical protein